MAEPHLLYVVIPFAAAVWWTKHWLMDDILARWRFVIASMSGSILWVYLAFASTHAVEGSGGVQIAYGSIALAYFSAFMAMVSVVGLLLGLFLWTEEEAEETARELPDAVQTGFGD